MTLPSRTVAAAIGLAIAWTGAAEAKTFEVTRAGDPAPDGCKRNDCSLREAVLRANARAGGDQIVLPNRKKDYRLTIPNLPATHENAGLTGDLDVANSPLKIVHPGRGRATIDADGLGDRAVESHDGAPLVLANLVVTGGDAVDPSPAGGAIVGGDDLRVLRSVLAGNRSENVGGAIDMENEGSLLVAKSTLRGNFAATTSGAIRSGGGAITVQRSKLRGNESPGDGGAIRLSSPGPVKILRSTIADNSSGGDGGGIQSDSEETLTISDSTISGNRAESDGGGLALSGENFPTTIVNSTISGNRTLDFGGGINVVDDAELRLNAVTIARNHGSADDEGAHAPGGGIFRHTTATVSVRNTIIALNRLGTEPIRNDCGGEVGEPFDSLGNNLLSTLEPSGICNGFDGPNDVVRSNPKIGKLRKNGGPTKTIALKKGSAAIGLAHKPSAPNRDQRGRKRDNNPDAGAFERGA